MGVRDCVSPTEVRAVSVRSPLSCGSPEKIVAAASTWGKAGEMTAFVVRNTAKVSTETKSITRSSHFLPDEHRQLCAGDVIPSTPGGGPPIDLVKVNECILRPGICGDGQCIDTPEGYECVCKPGYRQGPDKSCEGIQHILRGTDQQKTINYYFLTFI